MRCDTDTKSDTTASPSTGVASTVNAAFLLDSHVKYFSNCLNELPDHYVSLDTSRITVIYFCIVGLDMLTNDVVQHIGIDMKQKVISYIYSMQLNEGGFVGSFNLGYRNASLLCCSDCNVFCEIVNSSSSSSMIHEYAHGHIAMTYTAISTLLTLGDDLRRVNTKEVVSCLTSYQQSNGSFASTPHGSECDLRYVFCAVAISYMLSDWSGINIESTVSFILACTTYEGGMSLVPGSEAQGGATYCGIASLSLLHRLDALDDTSTRLLQQWCLQRQVVSGGYNGRTNKLPDSCYSFWIGATLDIIGTFDATDVASTHSFLLNECQSKHDDTGGFSKVPDSYPDILHTFYSIAYMSIAKLENIKLIHSALAIPKNIVQSFDVL